MASSAHSKSPYHPRSTFLTLFRLAYNRIWKSRALKFWEMFFWLFFATWLALFLNGFLNSVITGWIIGFLRLVLIPGTPILIGVWVINAHASSGAKDDYLHILPLNPYNILVPRMWAICVTWLQFFLPVYLLIAMAIYFKPPPFSTQLDVPGPGLGIETIATIGWMMLWVGWGIMLGSFRAVQKSRFSFLFFMFFYLPVSVVILSSAQKFMTLYFWKILPDWVLSTGLAGILLWIPLLLFGAKAWGERSR
jgi:hypothetical protein